MSLKTPTSFSVHTSPPKTDCETKTRESHVTSLPLKQVADDFPSDGMGSCRRIFRCISWPTTSVSFPLSGVCLVRVSCLYLGTRFYQRIGRGEQEDEMKCNHASSRDFRDGLYLNAVNPILKELWKWISEYERYFSTGGKYPGTWVEGEVRGWVISWLGSKCLVWSVAHRSSEQRARNVLGTWFNRSRLSVLGRLRSLSRWGFRGAIYWMWFYWEERRERMRWDENREDRFRMGWGSIMYDVKFV